MEISAETLQIIATINEKKVPWEFKNPKGSGIWIKGDLYFSPIRYILNGCEIRLKQL